jgi:hypothetical protein
MTDVEMTAHHLPEAPTIDKWERGPQGAKSRVVVDEGVTT